MFRTTLLRTTSYQIWYNAKCRYKNIRPWNKCRISDNVRWKNNDFRCEIFMSDSHARYVFVAFLKKSFFLKIYIYLLLIFTSFSFNDMMYFINCFVVFYEIIFVSTNVLHSFSYSSLCSFQIGRISVSFSHIRLIDLSCS